MAQIDAPGYWEPGPAPAPKRGLFTVAEVHDNVDPHLLMGANYVTNRCTAGCEWLDFCGPADGVEKDFMKLNIVRGLSSAVYDALDCAEVGSDSDELESRLRGVFDVKAEAVMEASLQAFMQGAAAISAGSVTDLVAVLDEHLAKNYAGLGALHLDRYTAVYVDDQNLLHPPLPDAGGHVETINGTPVVLGRGYTRASGKFWAGATGRISILRGPLVAVQTPPLQTAPPRVLVEQQFVILAECVSVWAEASVT